MDIGIQFTQLTGFLLHIFIVDRKKQKFSGLSQVTTQNQLIQKLSCHFQIILSFIREILNEILPFIVAGFYVDDLALSVGDNLDARIDIHIDFSICRQILVLPGAKHHQKNRRRCQWNQFLHKGLRLLLTGDLVMSHHSGNRFFLDLIQKVNGCIIHDAFYSFVDILFVHDLPSFSSR